MDPKAGLELLEKRKISLLGFKTRTVQPVAVCVCVWYIRIIYLGSVA